MRILGLTGSIGMGKSTAAAMLRRLRLPIYDADAEVHHLLARGGAAVPAVAAAFPDVIVDGGVDRQRLGAIVFSDPAALHCLEGIIHPLVRRQTLGFLRRHARMRAALVVLDIPLLFESRSDSLCDAVAVVTAPAWLQALRVLRRPGMTPGRLAGILQQQMSDAEKRRRAQYVVYTSLGKHETLRQLRQVIEGLRRQPRGRHRPGKLRLYA